MSLTRCYGPALVLLLYAVVRTAGATDEAWLVLFLVAEAVAVVVHVEEMRYRIRKHVQLDPSRPSPKTIPQERRRWSGRDMARDFVTLAAVAMSTYAVVAVERHLNDVADAAAAAKAVAESNRKLIVRLDQEGKTREQQFCERDRKDIRDLVKRLEGTRAYLRSPASQDSPGLSKFVRQFSLPQLKRDIAKERRNLPPVCRKK